MEKKMTKKELILQWFSYNNQARELEGTPVKGWTCGQVASLERKYSVNELLEKIQNAKEWMENARKNAERIAWLASDEGKQEVERVEAEIEAIHEQCKKDKEELTDWLNKKFHQIAGTDWNVSDLRIYGESWSQFAIKNDKDEAGKYPIEMTLDADLQRGGGLGDQYIKITGSSVYIRLDDTDVELFASYYKALGKVLSAEIRMNDIKDRLVEEGKKADEVVSKVCELRRSIEC